MTALITIRDMSKRYGALTALAGVDLDIRENEFLTMLGPSGSGKTTLLMILAGFVTPSGGRLTRRGESIMATPPEARNFGMVFQNYALFPHMSALANVAYPLRVRRWTRRQRRERAEQFLDLVGLHAHRHARPDQLSGGQQQRVALARALVFEPDLLLLDEPLSALDRNLRKQMQDELKRVHAEIGTTFIYVTHDQDEALAMSDRIAIFDHGRILQTGAPEDVYRQPANRFVAQFLGDTNILQLRVGEANGTTGVIGDVTVRLPAAGAMPLPRAGTVTLSLRPENVAVMADRTAAQPYANALPGRITGRTYRGSTEDLRVELDAGPAIQALQTTPCRGEARLAEGAACWVCWDADHAYLLDDPEAIGTPGGDAQNHHTDTEVYHVARRSA